MSNLILVYILCFGDSHLLRASEKMHFPSRMSLNLLVNFEPSLCCLISANLYYCFAQELAREQSDMVKIV